MRVRSCRRHERTARKTRPSINFSFVNKRLILGTWERIVIINHDNMPRDRDIYI
ncbi:MAG: YjbQ family protein [Candidatus Marinimicrobia bacterium]|nr:YjbQ family protein [Candidatus Neomarinimicrobiota bacterium]